LFVAPETSKPDKEETLEGVPGVTLLNLIPYSKPEKESFMFTNNESMLQAIKPTKKSETLMPK
jgi:hypothetical protein